MRLKLLLLPAVMVLAGCMSFDYIGQYFAPLPESSPVTLFKSRAEMPADVYRIIGRGVLTCPEGTDAYDIHAKLRSLARERGAEAICIVGHEKKLVGLYPREKSIFAVPSSANGNPDNLNIDGTTRSTNSFGEVEVNLAGEKRARSEYLVKVLLLKKRALFDAEMKKRRQ